MPGTRELTRRIKSIKSTHKITRAMQLVSAAKMRRAQQATMASRTYSEAAWGLIHNLSGEGTIDHPLLTHYPEAKKTGIVLISTNTGLVGGFNANLFGSILKLEKGQPELMFELVVLGKKAKSTMARLHQTIIAEFSKPDTKPDMATIYALAHFLTEQFMTGQFKNILVVYNHFISTLSQKVTIRQLLPLAVSEPAVTAPGSEFQFEPNIKEVMNHLLPRVIESQLYQAILESDASEHSARMVMMKNATDAAGDLIDDLTLTFNQLRQHKITTELSEITAGKIALEWLLNKWTTIEQIF